MSWQNRTKIVATLGPASSSEQMVTELVRAGVDVVRLNCAHADHAMLTRMIGLVRKVAQQAGRPVGVLADLQGPKIRIGRLKDAEPIFLKRGDELIVDATPGVVGQTSRSGPTRIGTIYRGLARDVRPGEKMLLDDGVLELRVKSVDGPIIRTRVVYGGLLHQFKGINLPGSQVSAKSLSAKDLADLRCVCSNGVDFVALSFVRTAEDVLQLRRHIQKTGADPRIIAKIERPEAVRNLDDIVAVADALMVARGDMGVELGPAAVPPVQKRIIEKCNAARKPVITATQMLESMIVNPRPTRAEASDVANAIYDGTSAVMLSAETASGKYPVRTVRTMEQIVRTAEREVYAQLVARRRRHGAPAATATSATVRAAAYAAYESEARLIVVYTETGNTANLLAGERPPTHIVALTPSARTAQRLALTWGITVHRIPSCRTSQAMTKAGDRVLREAGFVRPGDRIVQIAGAVRQAGMTNTMTIREL